MDVGTPIIRRPESFHVNAFISCHLPISSGKERDYVRVGMSILQVGGGMHGSVN